MNAGLVFGALVAGLLGGVHCAAMCGGFVTALAARDRTLAAPLLPARAIVAGQASYHAGRIATYALLGAALGGAGSAALLAAGALPIQRAAYVASNLLLLGLGASFVVQMPQSGALARGGARVFGAVLAAVGPLARSPGARGRVTMGLIWGLMPCGLVYAVLPLALLAGGPAQGALVMLAFGVGTLPSLLAGGLVVARLRSTRFRAVRWSMAGIVVAFGLLGLARAFVAPADSLLAFCLG